MTTLLKSIDDLPTVPGLYMTVTNPDSLASHLFLLEVDEQGQIHQINFRSMSREGVLDRDGWIFEIPVVLYGPYRLVPQGNDVDVMESAEGKWLAAQPDNTEHCFPSEEEACAFQRGYRVALGLDPMTGEPSV